MVPSGATMTVAAMYPPLRSRFWKAMGPPIPHAFFTTLSVVSYFFTWKQDASVLAAGADEAVTNSGASLGSRWADLLVHRLFGWGTVALIVLMWAISAKLLVKKASALKGLKWFNACVTGAFIISWVCAFTGSFAGADTVYQSGLGGSAGKAVVNWIMGLVGVWMTGFLLLLFIVLWFFCISRRFSAILTGEEKLFGKKAGQADDEEYLSHISD